MPSAFFHYLCCSFFTHLTPSTMICLSSSWGDPTAAAASWTWTLAFWAQTWGLGNVSEGHELSGSAGSGGNNQNPEEADAGFAFCTSYVAIRNLGVSWSKIGSLDFNLPWFAPATEGSSTEYSSVLLGSLPVFQLEGSFRCSTQTLLNRDFKVADL